MDKATERPWKANLIEYGSLELTVIQASTRHICLVSTDADDENQANARLIVTAVNSHDKLVALTKAFMAHNEKDDWHCWCTAIYGETGDKDAECPMCQARTILSQVEGTGRSGMTCHSGIFGEVLAAPIE